jgi:hypothetical protein
MSGLAIDTPIRFEARRPKDKVERFQQTLNAGSAGSLRRRSRS